MAHNRSLKYITSANWGHFGTDGPCSTYHSINDLKEIRLMNIDVIRHIMSNCLMHLIENIAPKSPLLNRKLDKTTIFVRYFDKY